MQQKEENGLDLKTTIKKLYHVVPKNEQTEREVTTCMSYSGSRNLRWDFGSKEKKTERAIERRIGRKGYFVDAKP